MEKKNEIVFLQICGGEEHGMLRRVEGQNMQIVLSSAHTNKQAAVCGFVCTLSDFIIPAVTFPASPCSRWADALVPHHFLLFYFKDPEQP